MIGHKHLVIPESALLRDALSILNEYSEKIVLVVDEADRFVGTITDGDIRRVLLAGKTLSSSVALAMNKNPLTVSNTDDENDVQRAFEKKGIRAVPVINDQKHILGLKLFNAHYEKKRNNIPVVIMAGGLGKRLGDLTKETPKPMLCVGSKPILEHTIDALVEQGFRNFFITTHYRSDKIVNYFGDGTQKGIKIEYIKEKQQLGTAGGLFLLKDKIESPFIVMNGDLIVHFNMNLLQHFHEDHKALITVCVKTEDFQFPYGVVEFDHMKINSIREKPQYSYCTNAGIYCFSKHIFDHMHQLEKIDMPQLINKICSKNDMVVPFFLHEYWLDVGVRENLIQAQKDIV